jgi:quinol monooxygenase YgiN
VEPGGALGRWKRLARYGPVLQIDAPHKFVQTRRYEWDHPTLGRRDTTVAYCLDPIETGTRVTIRHDGFGGVREAADEHTAGWERFLGWLQAYAQPDRLSAIVAQFSAGLEIPSSRLLWCRTFRYTRKNGKSFEAAFCKAAVGTQKEDGVVAYQLNRDAKDPTRYLVYERWRSFADLEAHLRRYITTLIKEPDAVLVGTPEFRVLLLVDG